MAGCSVKPSISSRPVIRRRRKAVASYSRRYEAASSPAWRVPPSKGRTCHGGEIPRRFIVKELRGEQRRELAVYGYLWRARFAPPATRVLGTDRQGKADYLFLEEVRPVATWPWSDSARAAKVCRVLAKLAWADPMVLPRSGSTPEHGADNLGDDSGMRHDGDSLRRMLRRNPRERSQAALAKFVLTFAPGPGEIILILGRVARPEFGTVASNLGDRNALQLATKNLPQRLIHFRAELPRLLETAGGVARADQRNRVKSNGA